MNIQNIRSQHRLETNRQTFRTGDFNVSERQEEESTVQRGLKRSEANNSALEARISKFINTSGREGRRKKDWKQDFNCYGQPIDVLEKSSASEDDTLLPDKYMIHVETVNQTRNHKPRISLTESSNLIDTSEQTLETNLT